MIPEEVPKRATDSSHHVGRTKSPVSVFNRGYKRSGADHFNFTPTMPPTGGVGICPHRQPLTQLYNKVQNVEKKKKKSVPSQPGHQCPAGQQ